MLYRRWGKYGMGSLLWKRKYIWIQYGGILECLWAMWRWYGREDGLRCRSRLSNCMEVSRCKRYGSRDGTYLNVVWLWISTSIPYFTGRDTRGYFEISPDLWVETWVVFNVDHLSKSYFLYREHPCVVGQLYGPLIPGPASLGPQPSPLPLKLSRLLLSGCRDACFLRMFMGVVSAVVDGFRPEAVVILCGADTLSSDPLGPFNLTSAGIRECVGKVVALNLPLLMLGGGGYCPTWDWLRDELQFDPIGASQFLAKA